MRPNANSLHQLYRDRLSKAFLFDPTGWRGSESTTGKTDVDRGRDFAPIDKMRISELVKPLPYAPYHLINAALNVQGSDYANRRGRNATSSCSHPALSAAKPPATARHCRLESATSLDLATAMAVSGAAFSPNMGASYPAAHADARNLERPDGLLAQKSTLYRVFEGAPRRFNARTGADDQMVPMVRDYWTTL